MSRAGMGVLILAIVLSWLPGVVGIGAVPSVVMLGLVAAVALRQLRPCWLASATTLVAFHVVAWRGIPLLWAVSAGLLCYDHFAQDDLKGLWHGPRRAVTLGALLCLLSLLLTWSRSPVWASGYTYGYSPYLQSPAYRWDFAKYYFPGEGRAGRDQSLALMAEAALLGLVLVRRGWGAALLVCLGAWWLMHLGPYPGPWLFGLGLVLAGAGVAAQRRRD